MKIITKSNLNVRSIEEFIRVMLPEVDDEIEIEISENEKSYTAKVCNKDKISEFSYKKIDDKIDDQPLTMPKIALLKLYDKKYSWGSLMGVRPTKIFRRLLNASENGEEVESILKDFYLVSDEKIKLMAEIVSKEEKLLDDRYINLYVGIPFCPTKCRYCSFASYEIGGGVGRFYDAFVEALLKEIEIIAKYLRTYPKKISSIYFGGGTPSILKHEDLEKILSKINGAIDTKNLKEYCFECGREDTLDRTKLDILKKYGVNRISLNPQTFNEMTLKKLNRNFNLKNFDEIFLYAKKLNFDINMDIIIGLPGETTEDVMYTLDKILEYEIDNLTVHTLAFKRRSKLFKDNQNRLTLDRKRIEEKISKICLQKKLNPYYMYRQKNIVEWGENVGYALDGKESIFNMEMIEENQNTMALGGGGISKIVFKKSGENDYIERYVNPKDPALYIKELEKRCEEKINLFEKYK